MRQAGGSWAGHRDTVGFVAARLTRGGFSLRRHSRNFDNIDGVETRFGIFVLFPALFITFDSNVL